MMKLRSIQNLVGLSEEECYNLIEKMASNQANFDGISYQGLGIVGK